jgi:hypothetical protein
MLNLSKSENLEYKEFSFIHFNDVYNINGKYSIHLIKVTLSQWVGRPDLFHW